MVVSLLLVYCLRLFVWLTYVGFMFVLLVLLVVAVGVWLLFNVGFVFVYYRFCLCGEWFLF